MEPSDHDRIGGRYELLRRLARGGGGTVWQGYDHLLDRQVAVKHVVIPEQLPHDPPGAAARARTRVRSEARAAARLRHPGAVGIFDVVDEGDVFLVLEYVPWETLEAVCERVGPQREAEVARLGLGLLEVLEAAHTRGIVHRDVKPSNVFVAPADALAEAPEVVVKLTDFGIATIEGDARLTRTGATMGSPAYIAPEQAVGRPAAPAVDLWGLGASLYHAVEGVPPFQRSTPVATVHAVVHDPPRAFERAEELCAMIGALLAKEPADRPATGEIREALRTIAGPAAPPPVTSSSPVVVPVRSGDATEAAPDDGAEVAGGGRVPWAAVGAAALLLVAASVGGVAVLTGDGDPLDPTAPTAIGGDDGPDEDGGDVAAEQGDADAEEVDESFGPAVDLTSPPGGWRSVEGATYDLAIPPGWEVDPGQGNLVDHRDPDTGTYLRVDWTDTPEDDPVANWEAFAGDFAAGRDGYEEIELGPATFQGSPAAYWEYTYTAGGTELRAINLNVRVDDGRAYALNLQSAADRWDETVALFPALAGGFEDDRAS